MYLLWHACFSVQLLLVYRFSDLALVTYYERMTYFYPQRPKWTGSWRGRLSAVPCTSPHPPERADQTVSPPNLWPCQSWSCGAAEKQTNVATHTAHPSAQMIPDGRWTCCLQPPYRWLLVQREYIMKQLHKSIWNAMCTLKMKYFFFFFPITHANTQTNSDTEKTAFELIFTTFMLIKISVCLACW